MCPLPGLLPQGWAGHAWGRPFQPGSCLVPQMHCRAALQGGGASCLHPADPIIPLIKETQKTHETFFFKDTSRFLMVIFYSHAADPSVALDPEDAHNPLESCSSLWFAGTILVKTSSSSAWSAISPCPLGSALQPLSDPVALSPIKIGVFPVPPGV